VQRRVKPQKTLKRIKIANNASKNTHFNPKAIIVKLFGDIRYGWKKINNGINSAPIKFKMMMVICIIVFSTLGVLSIIVYKSGRNILLEQLKDTCNVLANNLSEYTKEQMVLENAEPGIGRYQIQEVVLRFKMLDIEGFQYAKVVNRKGQIIAHSDIKQRNDSLSSSDSILVNTLDALYWRENGDTTFEYFQPIFAPSTSGTSSSKYLLGAAIIGFSKQVLWMPIRRVQSAFIGSVILVTILSAIVIYIVASKMTAQINELSRGARIVGNGNLDVHIPVRRRDDLGRLVEDFNTMISQLRERLHMQKFVSKLTVDMIRKRTAMGDPPMHGGETKQVTILFSDIRNFSALTETLSPKEVVKLINIYLNLQANIIRENHGVVDKFIGDQVMSIFLGDSMADNAINAGAEIQRSIRELNKKRKDTYQVVLNVGVGLNVGPAVVGNMGSQTRMDYTVIGDVVNLANRLCAMAKPGQIIAPMDLIESLHGVYPIVRLNPVKVKGKRKLVEVFEIDYDRAIIM